VTVQITNRILLILMLLLSALMIPLVLYTSGPIRMALALITVIFLPGYTLLSAVFPRRQSLGGIQRTALGFGFSIIIVAALGLLLHLSGLGLDTRSILIAIVIWIWAAGVIALVRDIRLSPQQRPLIKVKKLSFGEPNSSRSEKFLGVSLAVLLVVLAGSFIYFALAPNQGEIYSEFYILDSRGQADNWPASIKIGASYSLISGVISHEKAPAVFRIDLVQNGRVLGSSNSPRLDPEQKWEAAFTLTAEGPAGPQLWELLLFKDGSNQPYTGKPLQLKMQVIP